MLRLDLLRVEVLKICITILAIKYFQYYYNFIFEIQRGSSCLHVGECVNFLMRIRR